MIGLLSTTALAHSAIVTLAGFTMHGAPLCPKGNAFPDQCGVSQGIYYAPAISETTQPTATQWGVYVRKSGQTWTSNHPQPWNLAGIDFGIGPAALISTFTDVANYPAGLNQCNYFADGSSHGVTGWPVGWPMLLCNGSTQADFVISGYNFGPTAYQGSPNGSHDCVNLVIQASNGTTYLPHITVTNNAFINGATCAPLISGVRYGLISSNQVFRGGLTVASNYVDGRNNDVGNCCLPPTNQGIFVATNNLQSDLDVELNYALRMPVVPIIAGWSTGNESACSNGQSAPYNTAGYNFIDRANYFDSFGATGGAGHWEMSTINVGTDAVFLCSHIASFNTIVWQNTTAAEGTSSFFMIASGANIGTLEYNAVQNNTIVTNLTGGKQIPELYDYYNWRTDAGNPNRIIIAGTGSSCSGLGWACGNPVKGQLTQGGTNNTSNAVVVLQNNVGTGPITGSDWNAGCNAVDTPQTICASNNPALIASVAYPNNGQTNVLNAIFNNRVVSVAGAEADHGTTTAGRFGYGVLTWDHNYIDGVGSGTNANNIPSYWSANPAVSAGGYQLGGGGGCAIAINLANNVELRTGGSGTYPQINQFTSNSGGC